MQAFTVHTGRAVPLRRSAVDTDQIIPSDYLKRVSRTGFADGLFAGWRNEPGFALDDPRYAGATVLLAGPDFGTGSSREHAVWALQDAGFRAVVAAGFGDIFRTNALANGLLPVQVPTTTVDALMAAVEAEPAVQVTIDLEQLRLRGAGIDASFPVDDHTRRRLLAGVDEIGLTLQRVAFIDDYERARPSWMPRTTP